MGTADGRFDSQDMEEEEEEEVEGKRRGSNGSRSGIYHVFGTNVLKYIYSRSNRSYRSRSNRNGGSSSGK